MKKPIPRKQLPGKNARNARTAKTGEHCPLTGWWAAAGRDADLRLIAEGSIMPADGGKSITWKLATSESGSPTPQHIHPPIGASLDRY